ncbi:DUF2163 domain-containing protein [Paraburkholderia sacchari]|uniref:DUF2163 domain-containing protein n=1 Tax=Paraburkholderia sacchari TaxID=159450 RepID=UPI001BCC0E26|nr:DUF2163 domain-containing protein [Paraburkholderia sacchari]
MRSISTAMNAWLQQAVTTFATCVKVTRTDGQIFGFTDHDSDIVYAGQRYVSATGYTASAIESSYNLSTSNLEVEGLLFPGGAVQQADVEGGVWNNAAVLIFGLNFADLTMGQINLTSGNLGQWSLQNGSWRAELRGLAQILQQATGEQFSPTCRATFGDSRCLIAGGLGPLTASGSVASIVTQNMVWNDPTLTQTGPPSSFVDTSGHTIPTATPYQVQVVAPSGAFSANTSVVDGGGRVYSQVSSSPGEGQYSVNSSGLYSFASNDAGIEVFINFTYTMGYFAYGKVTWTSGQNKGYTQPVKTFAPAVVTLALPTPFPIAPSDTYSIVAGCDKQFGTCKSRWNNVPHFRGEPYIPGPDVVLAPQGS